MKIRKTADLNWSFIILSLFCLCAFFYPDEHPLEPSDFSEIKITLNGDVERRKGSRIKHPIRFSAKKYSCRFALDKIASTAGVRSELGKLKKGRTLFCSIYTSNKSKLNDPNKTIQVYSLRTNEKTYFNIPNYNNSATNRNRKLDILFFVMGIMLMVNSLLEISTFYKFLLILFLFISATFIC